MGKNKWYNDFEGGGNPAFRSSDNSGAHKQKKSSALPGLFVSSGSDDITFSTIFKVIIKRLKRKWLALRFHGTQVSGSVFQRSTFFKIGFVICAAYYLVGGTGTASWMNSDSTTSIDWENETKLGVAAERTKSKPAKKEKESVESKPKAKPKPKTEASPVGAASLRGDQTQAYIQKFGPIAREEMMKFGVPASISLAQGLIESRAGTSKLAVGNNNHFGMKCFSRNCKKGHCSNFTDDSHKDFFLKFNDPKLSWRAHSKLISTGRYAKLKKYGRDYRKWAWGLKSVGYATDRTYAQKIIGMIERYNLNRFDR